MFIKILDKNKNYVQTATPARGLSYEGEQLVNAARNADGVVVAQKINRRLTKLDGVEWKHLTASEWKTILQLINAFHGYVEYWDPAEGKIMRMAIYWGNSSATPFKIDTTTGEVLEWINCKCNLIDKGLPLENI